MIIPMGLNSSLPSTMTFEDIQHAITNTDKYRLICTMILSESHCLIQGTIPIDREEMLINTMLNTSSKNSSHIIIYGKHANDRSVITRYTQLKTLGFPNVYIYLGGMFEWMLLQDIYGDSLFPTTTRVIDLLVYKPPQTIVL